VTAITASAATFQPGDRVLFQRGGEWRGSLLASSSGESGKPIVYADYGTDAKPKFWGSVVLDNARFTSVSGTVYRCMVVTPVKAVLVDHVFLFDLNGRPIETGPDAYAWNGRALTLNTHGGHRHESGRGVV
jgi:hypothetical protein